VAAAILFFFLHLNPHQGRTLREHLDDFDFVGLGFIVAGVICLLLGFNSSETSWSSAETITLIPVGTVLILCGFINEFFTKRSPIIPPRLFKTRTTAFLLIDVFLHAVAFFAGTYYIPLYFQILGSSPTGAGVRTLPFSLTAPLFSAVSGIPVTRYGEYRFVIWFGWTFFLLGYGLMIMLDDTASL
jgi:hypothetical protein